jgi:hypothetical protein
MAVQARADQQNFPFVLSGEAYTRSETIQQDAGRTADLDTFTVMAKDTVTIPTTMTADGGNTGDGTVTAVAAANPGSPLVGDYTLECTAAVTNGGVFKLTDPGSNIVATELTMQAGAGAATIFNAGGMIFTVTDGAADFIVGDKFTIAIAANGKWVPFDPSAVDGAEIPLGIFCGDTIATASLVAGDITDQPIYEGGTFTFDSQQLVFDDGVSTLATVTGNGMTVQDALGALGMFAENTVDIDELENS